MCLICTHFQANKLTTKEAMRNLDEMWDGLEPEHVREVAAMIIEAEIKKIEEEMVMTEDDLPDFDMDDLDISFDDLFV